ncbi:MAG: hypothetical protein ACI3XP_01245 [Eubacteriales bacterium]
MKLSVRILSALLLCALLLPACAKGEDNKPSDTSAPVSGGTADTSAPAETTDPNARKNHLDSLPADLNFNGESVVCLFRGTMADLSGEKGGYWITNDVCGSDNIGETVSDAVWERNATVRDRLNIDLQWVPTDGGNLSADQTIFRQTVMTSDDSFHFFLPTGNTSSQAGLTMYMRDLTNIPYVDWESPWWWTFANEALSLDSKTHQFVVGDMLLTNLAQTCIMFFNKDIYEDVYGNPDDLYQLTLDGKFTVDRLHELSSGAYNDANGDGVKNDGDVFGLLWSGYKTEELAGYVASCDLDLYTRDENGGLVITMDNERTVTAIEKLYKLMNENEGSRIGTGSIFDQRIPFSEGAGLFLGARMITATTDELREMEQEYGILPMPKLDEEQERYLAGVHESGTVLCVPKSTGDKKFEVVGATFEALCGEAHRSYMDAFLETALKMKYSRDALSGQCIDLIIDGLTKNTLQEYSNYTATIMSTCIFNPIINNPGTFASAFRKVGPAAQKSWDKAISSLELE